MGRRNVDDGLRKDVIVDIPKNQEHRFGCSGSMLKPSRASVEALVEKIPRGMVITTPFLRNVHAESHFENHVDSDQEPGGSPPSSAASSRNDPDLISAALT